MGNSQVKQHYETAQKTGVFRLSNKLTEFPSRLFDLTDVLRTLDLSENRLTVLPNEVSSFVNLKNLRLNCNRLTTLPDSIGSLKKLEHLCVTDNALVHIPSTISQLSCLKQVNLSGNNLTEFPSVFQGLSSLYVLDLSRNKIVAVPDSVKDIHAVELVLSQNQISSLSEEIAKCPHLRILRLEENCLELSAVPHSLLADSTVSVLTLEGNLFEMKALADLDGYSDYMDRYTAVKKKLN